MNPLTKFAGYRTYIVAALIGVLTAVKFLGYVNEETYVTFFGLLTGGGLAALRASKESTL